MKNGKETEQIFLLNLQSVPDSQNISSLRTFKKEIFFLLFNEFLHTEAVKLGGVSHSSFKITKQVNGPDYTSFITREKLSLKYWRVS